MIKILVWGATDTVGGVEAVLWNYVSHIPTNCIQFDFINTYEDISIGDEVRARGSKVFSLPNRRENIFKYKKELKKFMIEHASEYQAVWLNDCMFGNIDILKLAKKYGIERRIIHAHNSLNMGGGISRLIRHKINSWLLRFYVTDYWACSMLAGKWSYPQEIFDSGRLKVIPNAVDVSLFSVNDTVRHKHRQLLGVSDKIVFGHVGRFHFQKNHMFLIDLFYQIHQKRQDTVLVLIGSGEDEEKVRSKVNDYGIQNCVLFLGIRKDTNELYQAMDAFLLPSLFEGLPVVLVEAQASGLPCYVADTITKESDISGNVKFYSLEHGAEVWAMDILESFQNFKRKEIKKIITEKGYSIENAANDLMIELGGHPSENRSINRI